MLASRRRRTILCNQQFSTQYSVVLSSLFSVTFIYQFSACLSSMARTRNVIVATGLVLFAAGGLAFPFYIASARGKPVIDSSKPLPPQATFRGPYINTGSRDIGPDHQTYPKK